MWPGRGAFQVSAARAAAGMIPAAGIIGPEVGRFIMVGTTQILPLDAGHSRHVVGTLPDSGSTESTP